MAEPLKLLSKPTESIAYSAYTTVKCGLNVQNMRRFKNKPEPMNDVTGSIIVGCTSIYISRSQLHDMHTMTYVLYFIMLRQLNHYIYIYIYIYTEWNERAMLYIVRRWSLRCGLNEADMLDQSAAATYIGTHILQNTVWHVGLGYIKGRWGPKGDWQGGDTMQRIYINTRSKTRPWRDDTTKYILFKRWTFLRCIYSFLNRRYISFSPC